MRKAKRGNFDAQESKRGGFRDVKFVDIPLAPPLPRPRPLPLPRPRPLKPPRNGAPSLFTLDTSSWSSRHSRSYFWLCQSAGKQTNNNCQHRYSESNGVSRKPGYLCCARTKGTSQAEVADQNVHAGQFHILLLRHVLAADYHQQITTQNTRCYANVLDRMFLIHC